MFKAIVKEIKESDDFLAKNEKIKTLYIGGGTPSLFTVDMLSTLIENVKQRFEVDHFREVTIETNPDDLTPDYLRALSQTECNRLSIGIQSFNDDILKFLNRRHDSVGAIKAVEEAQKQGFNNLSLDLIYGIEGQTLEMIQSDLKTMLSLAPTHISAYHLTIEERSLLWKMLQRGEISQVDESVSESHFSYVSEHLIKGGFEHYEVSNFAKKGYKALHNSAYWESIPYIGFGPSAHSFNGQNIRRWNVASNLRYLRSIESGECQYETETLSITERVDEEIMTRLRSNKGVDLDMIAAKYGANFVTEIMSSAKPFIKSNLLIFENNILRIEPKNFLKSDYIIGKLFL